MERQRIQSLLRQIPLLSGVDETERALLAEHARVLYVDAGQPAILRGEPLDGTWLVLSGALEAQGESADDAPFEAGAVLAPLALLDTARAPESVVARVPTQVLVLDQSGLRALRDAAPEAAARVYEAMARNIVLELRRLDLRPTWSSPASADAFAL